MVVTIKVEGSPIPQAEIDQVVAYIRGRWKPAPGARPWTAAVQRDFKRWCTAVGESTAADFSFIVAALADELGTPRHSSEYDRYFVDVALKKTGEQRVWYYESEQRG